ncbi:MBOAT family O-acyltransferase [Tissierella sp. Yu-01]|uniref:MBOAT family O-acyltransferase n=1 Tax=Tissierella sp. Yu-01 TaxID=3035694 RepID=UPI00240D0C05|nr:MBOAT family O-acyltransferase [Tissierella sp. Yu-01]WFA08031.1 MBOAT family O-acyltransferase [Tissierella sp. Yu-01]
MYLLLMVIEVTVLWGLGFKIDMYRGKPASKLFLILSLIVGLGALGFFKYADFFLKNINALINLDLPLLRIALPIGISFYTFQILSYSIDLYWGKTEVQKSLLDFATYVMLFPQLIAGPIVRYADIAAELENREHTIARFSFGARRFVIGLAKKVLISNLLGELVEIIRQSPEVSVLGAWIYVIAFTLHIYFDFSGYSDMAIGLGHIFGFEFLENFNYPYTARSITDFWRRWHMSLSSWFRDYVYIPLGGNRKSTPRFIFNILIVWFLTGFWHGADWNFIIWGLFYGILLLIEKFLIGGLVGKLPNWVQHIYVMLIVMVGWVFFDAKNLLAAGDTLSRMFGIGSEILINAESLYYLRSYLFPLIIAIVGCTSLPKRIAAKLDNEKIMIIFEPLYIAVLLVITTAFLVDGSFNPFIYFRF